MISQIKETDFSPLLDLQLPTDMQFALLFFGIGAKQDISTSVSQPLINWKKDANILILHDDDNNCVQSLTERYASLMCVSLRR